MKRLLTSRWTQLVAALVLLAGIVALYTAAADHLPPRPRMSLQIDGGLMAISPDGKQMVTLNGASDAFPGKCELVLWNLETGKRRWSTIVDQLFDGDFKFSPDSKWLAAKNKMHFLVWDTSDGHQRLDKVLGVEDGMGGEFFRTQFSPDGRYLLLEPRGMGANAIIFWDLATNQERTRIDGRFKRFSDDGKHFAVVQEPPDPPYRYNLSLWEMPEGDALPRLLKRQQIVVGEFLTSVVFAFSNDLQTCAFGCIHNNAAPNEYDLKLLDLTTDDDTPRIIYRHTELGDIHFDQERCAMCLEFSPHGRSLMATIEGGESNADGALVISAIKHVTWNAQGEIQAVHFPCGESRVSPCGRWLLVRDETGADVWELGTPRKQVNLHRQTDHDPGFVMAPDFGPEHTIPVAEYQFSSDGHFVMVTGFQTTMTPNLIEMVLTRQWSRINTPETVAVGRLWDVERGEEIATFLNCSSAWFSPDGHTLATIDDSNHLQFWTVPPRRPVGFILALTTATWGLVLLACWAIKRRFGRKSRSPALVNPQVAVALPHKDSEPPLM